MTTLHVTFYSYKGGVGRTLALLNVAVALAESGFKVVAIDLDLEAPGFGMSGLTRRPPPHERLGFSDLVIDRVSGYVVREIERFCYHILPERCEDRLWLFPAGLRAQQLVQRLPTFYREDVSQGAIFHDVLGEIVKTLEPDFVLLDSRTGAADIAAIPTIELSEVLVAVTGLSEQNIYGMEGVLELFRNHEGRPLYGLGERAGEVVPQLQLLVLSPLPERVTVDGREFTLDQAAREVAAAPELHESMQDADPLYRRVVLAQETLLGPVVAHHAQLAKRGAYSRVLRDDLLHHLTLEPEVPVLGELQLDRVGSRLPGQYRRLARALVRAHPTAAVPAALEPRGVVAPWLGEVGRSVDGR